MFRRCCSLHAGSGTLRLRWRHKAQGAAPYFPLDVVEAAKSQHASKVARDTGRTVSEAYQRVYSQSRTLREANQRFGEGADDAFVPKGAFSRLARTWQLTTLQEGLGDNESLHSSADYGYSDLDIAAHGRRGVLERVEPPAPYNKMISRRMAEGRLWPSILGTQDRAVRAPSVMTNDANMSPSEQRFSANIEYWLRRNLRAMPQHIGEQIDFAEMMIERCFVSRRCRDLYIVWSTVSGSARLKIEPLLVHLTPWVIRTIKRRLKVTPNIPRVFWVYDSGAIPTEMPNKLRHEIRAVHANQAATIEQRIDYLRQLDSVEHRMRGVPWFMPYLWAKEQKKDQSKQMREDFVAAKQRREAAAAAAESKGPQYVS